MGMTSKFFDPTVDFNLPPCDINHLHECSFYMSKNRIPPQIGHLNVVFKKCSLSMIMLAKNMNLHTEKMKKKKLVLLKNHVNKYSLIFYILMISLQIS